MKFRMRPLALSAGRGGLLVNPDRDLVAVYVGFAKDDQFSELDVPPRLRQVLEGVDGPH